jgi:hypothetical protein
LTRIPIARRTDLAFTELGILGGVVRKSSWRFCAALIAATLPMAACMQTSRVDDTVTPQKLANTKKAVAVMRLGTPAATCLHIRLLLGTREGDGYRRGQVVTVTQIKSTTQSQVAEVELDPGEHHIIGFSCVSEQGQTFVNDATGEYGLSRTSYARFTLAAGEIVNVGYFHFNAHFTKSAFGKGARPVIEISDWPLPEIERFKTLRPAVYAQMTTRLMVMGDPPTPEAQQSACETYRKLKAEGKVGNVPKACEGLLAKARS